MDVRERLSFEAVAEHSVLACEHLHRYEFAATLCNGLRVLDLACGTGYGSEIMMATAAAVHGVDNDAATIDLAAASVGRRTAATFETADAVDFLGQDLASDYDMIVCFEGLEHLHDLPTVIGRLATHLEHGVRLVASVPNSEAFDADNRFHVTDFGYESVLRLLAELPGLVMIQQYLAEGSLICANGAGELDSRLVHLERAEPEYANHFLLISDVAAPRVLAAHRTRMLLTEAPVHNRYLRNLEVANRELRNRNSELARKVMHEGSFAAAKAGSAAPAFMTSFASSLERRVRELEDVIQHQAEELAQRAGELAARDDMILAQRRELLKLRQELVAFKELSPTQLGSDSA